MEDEDFEAAEGDRYRTIEISDFVPYEEIDPIYFERTYYVGPDDRAEKVYVLLRKAMEASGLAAVATYVMRSKQQLGCLRVRDGVIILEKMYFADEVRPTEDIEVTGVSVGKRELKMAAELIERFTGRFDIAKYRDEYREALLGVIKAKNAGEDVHVDRRDREPQTEDLLEAPTGEYPASTSETAAVRRTAIWQSSRRTSSRSGRSEQASQATRA